jgi:aspartyl-tRNA(Asn)/glutamyl-tRNA(Gln) amidotransferase subunit A
MESVREVAAATRQGKRRAVDTVRGTLDQLGGVNGRLGAFHEIYAEEALGQAEVVDRAVQGGHDPGPLAGVPIALKDNIVTPFGRTTCSSRILESFQGPYWSTVAKKLVDAGAVIIGKTNCDEFAMGSSTEHCAWGPTKNPWDVSRVPGGSSGGSAAAVASRMCLAALGSDTGGSIRQPAALCGIVGVKPTYGRVSRFGLVAFGSSLDQIGPFTTNVADAALLLQVFSGSDPRDSTSADVPVPDYVGEIEQAVEGLRIGVPAQYLSAQNDSDVNAAIQSAIDVYRSLGATIVDVELPLTDYGISTYYVITSAEASSNLARYDGIRYGHRAKLEANEELFDLYAKSRAEGFGPEVQRRIMLGTYVLSSGYYDAYYKRALQVRRLIKREYDAAFQKCHAILGPTSPTPAFEIGRKADPLTMYLCDVYTVNANIAGICGMSIPCGFTNANGRKLPVGMQLQCQAFDESTMFRVARMFERATDHHHQSPPIRTAG